MDVSFIWLKKLTCDGFLSSAKNIDNGLQSWHKGFFVITQFSRRGILVSLDRLHPLPDPNENGLKSNTVRSLIEAEQRYVKSRDDLLVSIHLVDLESTKCQWSRLEPKYHKSLPEHSQNTGM